MVKQVTPLKYVEEGQRLWRTERQPAGCSNCRRSFVVLDSQLNTRCPICHVGLLEPQPIENFPEAPEKILPFEIKMNDLYNIFNAFTSGIWIKLEGFSTEKLLEQCQAIYWPLWLVDSNVNGQWQMEAGFDYQVESSKEYFQNGQWLSRKVLEDRIRWEQRLGNINYQINNSFAPALEEHTKRQKMTGLYHLEKAKEFQPDFLENALVEVLDLPPKKAWPLARPQMDRALGKICAKAASAQHSRNFAFTGEFQNLNWTLFLLPVYTTTYLDDEKQPQIVFINGVTGEIHGPRLASQKRGLRIAAIIGAMAGLMLLLSLIGFLLTSIFPPVSVTAILAGILGFGLGIGALIPAIWPAQWNHKQHALQEEIRK